MKKNSQTPKRYKSKKTSTNFRPTVQDPTVGMRPVNIANVNKDIHFADTETLGCPSPDPTSRGKQNSSQNLEYPAPPSPTSKQEIPVVDSLSFTSSLDNTMGTDLSSSEPGQTIEEFPSPINPTSIVLDALDSSDHSSLSSTAYFDSRENISGSGISLPSSIANTDSSNFSTLTSEQETPVIAIALESEDLSSMVIPDSSDHSNLSSTATDGINNFFISATNSHHSPAPTSPISKQEPSVIGLDSDPSPKLATGPELTVTNPDLEAVETPANSTSSEDLSYLATSSLEGKQDTPTIDLFSGSEKNISSSDSRTNKQETSIIGAPINIDILNRWNLTIDKLSNGPPSANFPSWLSDTPAPILNHEPQERSTDTVFPNFMPFGHNSANSVSLQLDTSVDLSNSALSAPVTPAKNSVPSSDENLSNWKKHPLTLPKAPSNIDQKEKLTFTQVNKILQLMHLNLESIHDLFNNYMLVNGFEKTTLISITQNLYKSIQDAAHQIRSLIPMQNDVWARDNFAEQRTICSKLQNTAIDLLKLPYAVGRIQDEIERLANLAKDFSCQDDDGAFKEPNKALELSPYALQALMLRLDNLKERTDEIIQHLELYPYLKQRFTQFIKHYEDNICQPIEKFKTQRFQKDDNQHKQIDEIVSFAKQERLEKLSNSLWEKDHPLTAYLSSWKRSILGWNETTDNTFGEPFKYVTIFSQKKFLRNLILALDTKYDSLPQPVRKSSIFQSMGCGEIFQPVHDASYTNAKKYLIDFHDKLQAIDTKLLATIDEESLLTHDFFTEVINLICNHLNAASTGIFGESPALPNNIYDSHNNLVEGGYLLEVAKVIWTVIASSKEFALIKGANLALNDNYVVPIQQCHESKQYYDYGAPLPNYPYYSDKYAKTQDGETTANCYKTKAAFVLNVRKMVGKFAETALAYQHPERIVEHNLENRLTIKQPSLTS